MRIGAAEVKLINRICVHLRPALQTGQQQSRPISLLCYKYVIILLQSYKHCTHKNEVVTNNGLQYKCNRVSIEGGYSFTFTLLYVKVLMVWINDV